MSRTDVAYIEPEDGLARLDTFLDKVTERLALVAVGSVLIIAVANCANILLRNFFSLSLYGMNEINILLVAIAVSSCLPSGMSRRAALTIDVVDKMFPPVAVGWIKFAAAMLMALFFGLLAWRFGVMSWQTGLQNQTTVMTGMPKAPFYWGVTTMIGAAALVQVVVSLRVGVSAARATPRGGWLLFTGFLLAMGVLTLLLTGTVRTSIFMVLVPKDGVAMAIASFVLLWVLILLMVPLGPALGLVGLLGVVATLGLNPALNVLGVEPRSFIAMESLSVLPLFLLMGSFCAVSGIGSDVFRLAHAILGHLRGGLAHASVAACAGFGSMTGSGVATQLTIGRVATPEMRSRGYAPELTAGTIAAGGTLGQLIPPANAMIFYAMMTESSVGRLFMAAFLPGIMCVLLYKATVAVWCWIRPQDGPRSPRSSLREVYEAVKGCWAPILLLGLVLGGIYTGYFTDLEAGSVGAVGAFLLAILRGRINRATVWKVMGEAVQSMALIYSLLFGVLLLSFYFGISGVPEAFINYVLSLELSPVGVIVALVLCYLILGTAMDSMAMMVITIPIFLPLVTGLGYDPLWWGVVTILCMEAGQISPPFGINIFMINVLQPDLKVTRAYLAVIPFFLASCIAVALLIAFPIIATWLPDSM